jgi:hypothetical protein
MQIHVSEACFSLQTDEPISYPCTFVHAGAVRRPSLQGPAPIALKLLQEAHFITSCKGEIYRYANRSSVLLLIKQGCVFHVLFLDPYGKHAQLNMSCIATSQQCTPPNRHPDSGMLTARLNGRDNANLKRITNERRVDRILFIV